MSTGLSNVVVGVVGCGNMGGAIARGLHKKGHTQFALVDLDYAKRDQLSRQVGGEAYDSLDAAVAAAEVVVLAVKPKFVIDVLSAVEWPDEPRTLISVCAGVHTTTLRGLVPANVCVVRAMPNMPASIGAGVTAVLSQDNPLAGAQAAAVFDACGTTVALEDERLFDAVTALSGSGPAFVFVAIEALADGGVRAGLTRDVALRLATHTVLGSAQLVADSGLHPAQLKDAVASPGGTTIHGLGALEAGGFRSSLIQAVGAASKRGAELGKVGRR